MEVVLKFSVPDDICTVHRAIRAVFNLACITKGSRGIQLAEFADQIEKQAIIHRLTATCRDCRES